MLTEKPTVGEIRALRENEEIGLAEARARLNAQWTLRNLEDLRGRTAEIYELDQLEETLRDLIDLLIEERR